jgi:hypothetical protein
MFRRILARSSVILLGVDLATRHLHPQAEASKLYCAEVCIVGIQPKLVEELRNIYQFELSPGDSLNGSVKENNQRLQFWIGRTAAVLPEPTYEQIARDTAEDHSKLVFAADALSRANEVSSLAQDRADQFPEFLRQAINALGELGAKPAGLSGQNLAQFLASAAPLAEYAPGGNESVTYTDPFTGRSCTTGRHLKPRTERRGYMAPTLKPRLFFDVLVDPHDAKAKYAVVLYFGPHPRERQNIKAGDILVRYSGTGPAGGDA